MTYEQPFNKKSRAAAELEIDEDADIWEDWDPYETEEK